MKSIISEAFLLACAFSLDAQIVATLNRLPNGSNRITIRNDTALSVVAFALRANISDRSEAPFVRYYDPAAKPLLPKEEFTLPPMWVGCPIGTSQDQNRRSKPVCELEQPIVAGILADGSPVGDSMLLTLWMLRRGSMLVAVETTLEALSDAGRRNIPRDQWIEEFKKMSDSLNRSYLLPEQQAGREVYQSMVGKLMNLPEVQAGSPFPPASFVDQQTAILRQQRLTMLESQPTLQAAALVGR
jgi:hypothetical protein